jgi:hypothetical protein
VGEKSAISNQECLSAAVLAPPGCAGAGSSCGRGWTGLTGSRGASGQGGMKLGYDLLVEVRPRHTVRPNHGMVWYKIGCCQAIQSDTPAHIIMIMWPVCHDTRMMLR